jgi:hypothetical protein
MPDPDKLDFVRTWTEPIWPSAENPGQVHIVEHGQMRKPCQTLDSTKLDTTFERRVYALTSILGHHRNTKNAHECSSVHRFPKPRRFCLVLFDRLGRVHVAIYEWR